MKSIIKIIIPILLLSASCKSQIVNIEDYDGIGASGKYYKDINNVLNPFTGTYVYTNGDKSFKVILRKKEHSSMGGVFYEDLLIGEYEYKVNTLVVVSTLNKLNTNYDNGISHSIDGNNILRGVSRACYDCPSTEIFVECGLTDSKTNNVGTVFIRRITTAGGQPAIEFKVRWEIRGVNKSLTPAQLIANGEGDASFPPGDYIMIKQ